MPNLSLIGNICNFELSLSLIDIWNRYERSQNLTLFNVFRSNFGFVILNWYYPSVDMPNMSLIGNICNFELSLIDVRNQYVRSQNLTLFVVLRSSCGFVISNWKYPTVYMPNMSLIGNICNFELSLRLIDVQNRYERSQNLTSFDVLRSSYGFVILNW